MSWDQEIESTPTRTLRLLANLLGRRITRLAHYAEELPEALLRTVPFSGRGISPQQLLSFADGPAVVVADGEAILVGHSAELLSLTIEPFDEEATRAEWPVVFEANDPTYSEAQFAALLGRRILAIEGFQWTPDIDNKDPRRGPVYSLTALDRPREALLVLHLEGDQKLVFAYGLVDAPNDFALLISTETADLGCRKLFRLPGPGENASGGTSSS